MGGSEGQGYGIIAEIQGFWRAKNDFDWSMEDLGEWGEERVRLVMSDIDGRGRRGEAV